jgi:hypothetical protein
MNGDLEKEQEERLEAQRRIEELERELSRSEEELDGGRLGARPWWRKPILIITLLQGLLVVWLTSLAVALNFLYP